MAPDVLLVTVDTLRSDFVGVYGGPGDTTPNLDAWAAGAVVFDRAVAASSRTVPSHASILTSRFVNEHSVGFENGSTRLGEVETLATDLRNAGYDTAAFVSNFVLDARVGLDRGFELYDDRLPDAELNRPYMFERRAEDTTQAAAEWLVARGPRPYFLWVHYQDPHGPYTPPEPFDRVFDLAPWPGDRLLPVLDGQAGEGGIPAYQLLEGTRRPSDYRSRYAGEIRYFDTSLGRLLKVIRGQGRDRPLVTLLTADHGESLGEEGHYFSHGHGTTPEQSWVPFVLAAPDLSPGRSGLLVSHVDVRPTVLDLAGLEVPEEASGLVLTRFLGDRSERPDRTVYCDVGLEVGAFSGDAFVRIRAPKPEEDRPELGSFLWEDTSWRPTAPRADLARAVGSYLRRRVPHLPASPLDEAGREKLRALGYLE
ncbi:MAG: sulfatase [Thermoanaerobaculia bacterium]|nr:sulfatase [Thermoanaerobaculia bacterium]